MKHEYDEEDKYVAFHEDDDELDTIRIPLPRLEEWYSHHLKRDVTREEARGKRQVPTAAGLTI